MHIQQQAIRLTKDNVSVISDSISDFTAQDLLDEYGYMLDNNINVILVRAFTETGVAVLSHVVSESMFYANARPVAELDDKTYVYVEQL